VDEPLNIQKPKEVLSRKQHSESTREVGTSGDPDNSGKVPYSSKERRSVGGNVRRDAR
jgi:hypothetical protein